MMKITILLVGALSSDGFINRFTLHIPTNSSLGLIDRLFTIKRLTIFSYIKRILRLLSTSLLTEPLSKEKRITLVILAIKKALFLSLKTVLKVF